MKKSENFELALLSFVFELAYFLRYYDEDSEGIIVKIPDVKLNSQA